MSVTIYSSTDTSAPTISRTNNCMIPFLDAVLVSGYGTQSSCGWTKSYSNGTDSAVYKAPTALGNFYMFVEDAGVVASNYYTKVRFAESASGISTSSGVEWPIPGGYDIPPSDTSSYQYSWAAIVKTTTNLATSTNVRWSLINNSSKGFYLWVDILNETASAKPTSASIYYCVKPTMLYTSYAGEILTGFRYATTSHGWDLAIPTFMTNLDTRYYWKTIYKFFGKPYLTQNVDYMGGSRVVTGQDYLGAAVTNYGGYPYITGDMLVSDISLYFEGEHGIPVAKLPGILQPLHNRPLNHLDTLVGSSPYASSTYVVWCCASGQVLIDTTDNW